MQAKRTAPAVHAPYEPLECSERELHWLSDGMDMVLDGLRDQLTSEPEGTPDWEGAKEAVEAAEALRARIQFWTEGGEHA